MIFFITKKKIDGRPNPCGANNISFEFYQRIIILSRAGTTYVSFTKCRRMRAYKGPRYIAEYVRKGRFMKRESRRRLILGIRRNFELSRGKVGAYEAFLQRFLATYVLLYLQFFLSFGLPPISQVFASLIFTIFVS